MSHSDENDKYTELAAMWADRSINEEQRREFNAWYHKDQDQPLLIPETFAADKETHKARIYQKVLTGLENASSPAPSKLWRRIFIAASVFILCSAALYFYIQSTSMYDLDKLAKQYGYGSNIAVLTKPDGSQSLLKDSVFNMSSEAGRFNAEAGKGFASIATPRGSRHQVLLEDGTKIWLGAASSITYPVTFNGPSRTIRLSGEAYFEVAHQPQKPFHVKIISHKRKLDIAVIGTKFNVSAYPEDPEVRTHVFEGSVKLSSANHTAVLTKGEKVIFKGGVLLPKEESLDQDWMRAGTLYFDNEDIKQVMRMIAREYDVELVYHGRPRRTYVSGAISRKKSLRKIMELIEYAIDYKFLLEEGRVTIFEPNEIRY